jgi:hypothetical protein
MMKFVKYTGYLALCLLVMSCEEFEDDSYDFSNSLPQFVELSSGSDVAATPGDTVTVNVRVRENLFSDINVGWETTGNLTTSGTVVIPRDNLSTSFDLILPDTPGEATVTLVSVDNGLSLGRPNAASSAISRKILWE